MINSQKSKAVMLLLTECPLTVWLRDKLCFNKRKTITCFQTEAAHMERKDKHKHPLNERFMQTYTYYHIKINNCFFSTLEHFSAMFAKC